MPASDAAAGGISFSPRRYAYRKGSQFPALRRSGPVDPEVLTAAEYFVTVHLGALQPQLVVEYPAPRAAVMEDVADDVSPLLRRLDAGVRAQLFGRREVRVRRPNVVADDGTHPRTVAGLRRMEEAAGRQPQASPPRAGTITVAGRNGHLGRLRQSPRVIVAR